LPDLVLVVLHGGIRARVKPLDRLKAALEAFGVAFLLNMEKAFKPSFWLEAIIQALKNGIP
jgi:5-enolpyruvylshikimate-3-phosphate synthase